MDNTPNILQSYECVTTKLTAKSVTVRLIDCTDTTAAHTIIEIPFTSLPFGKRDLCIGQSFYWDITFFKDEMDSVSVYRIPEYTPTSSLSGINREARELALKILSMGCPPQVVH